MSRTAYELRIIQFPDCASRCGVIKIMGAGECESICPYKFDEHGAPKESFLTDDAERYWKKYYEQQVHHTQRKEVSD